MLALFIDTVSPRNRVLLSNEKKILAKTSWKPKQNEAEKLLPALQHLLRRASRSLSDITSIVVVQGPGRFTSTRVGITVANTLSLLLHIPLIGVDRLELLLSMAILNNVPPFPLQVSIESEQRDYFSTRFYTRKKRTPIHLASAVRGNKNMMTFIMQKDGTLLKNGKKIPSFSVSPQLIQLLGRKKKPSYAFIPPLYVREANITKRKKR